MLRTNNPKSRHRRLAAVVVIAGLTAGCTTNGVKNVAKALVRDGHSLPESALENALRAANHGSSELDDAVARQLEASAGLVHDILDVADPVIGLACNGYEQHLVELADQEAQTWLIRMNSAGTDSATDQSIRMACAVQKASQSGI